MIRIQSNLKLHKIFIQFSSLKCPFSFLSNLTQSSLKCSTLFKTFFVLLHRLSVVGCCSVSAVLVQFQLFSCEFHRPFLPQKEHEKVFLVIFFCFSFWYFENLAQPSPPLDFVRILSLWVNCRKFKFLSRASVFFFAERILLFCCWIH